MKSIDFLRMLATCRTDFVGKDVFWVFLKLGSAWRECVKVAKLWEVTSDLHGNAVIPGHAQSL